LDKTWENVGSVATVVDAGDPLDLQQILDDPTAKGISRLMVEGSGTMHTQFLTAGLADELHLVLAPFLVGDSNAPCFVNDGTFPWHRRLPGTS
jgi:5-amino-6-(5-phosphoribosylamino)uracil reductase